MDDDFQPRPYPPSVVAGGAALVVVLGAIVVSVLMVSSASVDVPRISPQARTPQPTSTSAAVPASPTAAAVAGQPAAPTGSDGFLDDLIPKFPALDRLTLPSP